MSISFNKVQITKSNRGRIFLAILGLLEISLTVLLTVSLSANLLFPQSTYANPGVAFGISDKLSYQGRLTDLSGNTLGGASGTNYCFRFSVYDSSTGGTKLWPSGTPSSETVMVKDGVFNTAIGKTASMGFDFTTQKTAYLNVEINATATTCGGAWENLDVRQRIDAVAYARAAEYIRSDIATIASGSGEIQLGTGTGAATPKYLSLDWKNVVDTIDSSCSVNGSVWYNSSDSRAKICQGSVIRDLVDGIMVREESVDAGRASVALDFIGTAVTASKMGNGVIRISIGGGGGGDATGSYYANPQNIYSSTMAGFGQSTSTIMPFFLPYNISLGYLRFIAPMTATASTTVGTTAARTITAGISSSWNAVIYKQNVGANSMSLTNYASGQGVYQTQFSLQAGNTGSLWTQTWWLTYPRGTSIVNENTNRATTLTNFNWITASMTQYTGTKYIDIPMNTSLAAGNYWIMIGSSSNSGASLSGTNFTQDRVSNNGSIYAAFQSISVFSSLGQMGISSATSNQMSLGFGSFSLGGAAGTTAALAFSNISLGASHNIPYWQMINLS